MLSYTLKIYCENKPGVLARIANLLRKRNINIEVLHVDTRKSLRRMHGAMAVRIDVEAGFKDEHEAEVVVKQLEKLINVLSVSYSKIKNSPH